MLPRSQHEQIRTWTRQRTQRYRRAVASACLPSSHRRGRKPPPMGYCPGIVPRHVVGRGADTNLQVGIGAVPVFNKDRHLTHLLPRHHRTHIGARLLSAFRSGTTARLACSRQRRRLLGPESRLREERLIAVLPQSEAARRKTPLWSIGNTKQPRRAVARLPGAPAMKLVREPDTGKVADSYVTIDATRPRLAPAKRRSSTPSTDGVSETRLRKNPSAS